MTKLSNNMEENNGKFLDEGWDPDVPPWNLLFFNELPITWGSLDLDRIEVFMITGPDALGHDSCCRLYPSSVSEYSHLERVPRSTRCAYLVCTGCVSTGPH